MSFIDWDERVDSLTLAAIVKKSKSKERILFNAVKEVAQLEELLPELPEANEVYKILSGKGGFSSIAVIKYTAEREVIKNLYVSTFRIGKKQFHELRRLHDDGRIEYAAFVCSDTFKRVDEDKDYDYFSFVRETAEELGWDIFTLNNHSKIILMQTEDNFYICETSSNLNENPKIEQYSFENDKCLFGFYQDFFESVKAASSPL